MPVVVDPSSSVVSSLLGALPAGSHGVESQDRLGAWLDHRNDEYLVVLGPSVPQEAALTLCDSLRFTRPTVSVVLVREVVDTDVLTKAMHAGARDVVASDDTAGLKAASDRAYALWVALRGPGGPAHSGMVISVFCPKGGVGKTTMAVNLALALANGGARQVCLVDLDLAFGDVAITMQLFPSHSIEHAIGTEDTLDYGGLDGLLTRHDSGLMVLAAPSLPDARDRVSPLLVQRIIQTLKEKYDYVVIDTAPAFDEATLTALDETDELIMVATLDVPTLKNVKVALETLDMLGVTRDHRHLLLNRADDEVGINAEKVEAILGMPISARVATSIDVAAATNAGRPILLSSPDHSSSRAVRGLATRVAGEENATTSEESDDSSNRRRRRRR